MNIGRVLKHIFSSESPCAPHAFHIFPWMEGFTCITTEAVHGLHAASLIRVQRVLWKRIQTQIAKGQSFFKIGLTSSLRRRVESYRRWKWDGMSILGRYKSCRTAALIEKALIAYVWDRKDLGTSVNRLRNDYGGNGAVKPLATSFQVYVSWRRTLPDDLRKKEILPELKVTGIAKEVDKQVKRHKTSHTTQTNTNSRKKKKKRKIPDSKRRRKYIDTGFFVRF